MFPTEAAYFSAALELYNALDINSALFGVGQMNLGSGFLYDASYVASVIKNVTGKDMQMCVLLCQEDCWTKSLKGRLSSRILLDLI